MAQQGRRPFYNTWGGVQFGSVPGASVSPRDSQSGLGVVAPIGSPAHQAAWDQFFGDKNTPSTPAPTAGQADINSDESFGGGAPVTANDHIAASVANNTSWLSKAGVAFPPPPPSLSSMVSSDTSDGWHGPTAPVPSGNFTTPYGPVRTTQWNPNTLPSNNPDPVAAVQQFLS